MRAFIVFGLLVFVLPIAAQRSGGRSKPSERTLACGQQIPWQSNLEAAETQARTSERPVFWYIPTVAGSPMDRKDVVDLYLMSGLFSDERVVTLVTRKTVPVKWAPRGEAQKSRGLVPLQFIEPGFAVLRPDGSEVGRVHEISTFHAPWTVAQIRRLLEASGMNADSAEVARARASGDPLGLAEELLREGDADGADAALASAPESPQRTGLRGRLRALRGESEAAIADLDRALADESDVAVGQLLSIEKARVLISASKYREAIATMSAVTSIPARSSEAQFLIGACHLRLGEDAKARSCWATLAQATGSGHFGNKAAAELERFGPFSRGFEVLEALPPGAFLTDPDGTRVPRKEEDLSLLTRQSVALLLRTQRGSGVWDDSNYDFGGQDSLPNVYVAVTALCTEALLEWRSVDPSGVDGAVARALAYMMDESHIAKDDQDELAWAHIYRIHCFVRALELKVSDSARLRRKLREVVSALIESQEANGAFRHEYPNPFVTASVIQALDRARSVGVDISKERLTKAGEILARCRGQDGTFSYGLPRRGGGSPVQGSAGRMPLCEHALLVLGKSNRETLAKSIATSFEHHGLLEATRKYDNHADRYANGGFFFWYDQLTRSDAIRALEGQERRDFLDRQRAIVLAIPEIDGAFVDSHELGKPYGTAMGLLTLSRTLEDAR